MAVVVSAAALIVPGTPAAAAAGGAATGSTTIVFSNAQAVGFPPPCASYDGFVSTYTLTVPELAFQNGATVRHWSGQLTFKVERTNVNAPYYAGPTGEWRNRQCTDPVIGFVPLRVVSTSVSFTGQAANPSCNTATAGAASTREYAVDFTQAILGSCSFGGITANLRVDATGYYVNRTSPGASPCNRDIAPQQCTLVVAAEIRS